LHASFPFAAQGQYPAAHRRYAEPMFAALTCGAAGIRVVLIAVLRYFNLMHSRAEPDAFMDRRSQARKIGSASTTFLSLRAILIALLFSLWHPLFALADVVVAGTSDNLYTQVSGATAKDFLARLAEALGVPIKYEGFGDETIDGSYRGSVFHVLSQYFPNYIIVVRTNAARVMEVTISKAGDGRQVVTAEAPMPQDYRQMTQTLVPLPLFNN